MDFGFETIVKAYVDPLCRSASRVWSLATEAFWIAIYPFLMVALVVVPVYLVDIRLVMWLGASSDLSDDSWNLYGMTGEPRTRLGVVITVIVLSNVLRLAWILPLGFCLYSHYWVAQNWRPVPAPEAPLKQVEGESRRRRYCEYCGIFQGDRTYHCRELNKCLPMFDHVCYWWTGAVWLHNIGAYVLFIFFLPVYQLFLLGISLWMTCSPQHYRDYNAYMAIGIPAGMALFPSLVVLWHFGGQLVIWNILDKESRKGIWFLNEAGEVEGWHPETDRPSTNPWNQGWRSNLRAMFSSRLKDTLECTTQGETSIALHPLGMTNRRANGASTGFEDDIEVGTLVRRSHSEA